MARSSWLARLIFAAAAVPVLGETVMRLRNYLIIANVLNGGVTDPHSIPPPLLKEMYRVGNRTGHYRAFLALLRNAASWQAATREHQNIGIPVLLVWGRERLGAAQRTRTRPAAHCGGSHDYGRARRGISCLSGPAPTPSSSTCAAQSAPRRSRTNSTIRALRGSRFYPPALTRPLARIPLSASISAGLTR